MSIPSFVSLDLVPAGDAPTLGETIDKPKLKLSSATGLADVVDHLAFFSPAILYLYARFTDDNLADFRNTLGKNVPIFQYQLSTPLFDGLKDKDGNPFWNHQIWAIEKCYYQQFVNFILMMTFFNSKTGNVWRFGYQPFLIQDPLELDKKKMTARYVFVGTFGFYGNVKRICFQMKAGKPTLTQLAPRPEDLVLQKALVNNSKPLAARQDYLLEEKLLEAINRITG